MRVNFDVTWEEFYKNVQTILGEGKKVVIWGAGACAARFISGLGGDNSFVAYYVDQSETKQNTMIGSVLVKSPQDLLEDDAVDVVIVATMYSAGILDELKKAKRQDVLEVYNAFELVYREKQCDYRPLEEHMEEIKEMLADDLSGEIVEFICDHRKTRDMDYSGICQGGQYFVEDIVRADPHAVFVDAGAYHGETIEEFIRFQKGQFEKVYAFEMDIKNFTILELKKFDERVKLFNYGLWDEQTTARYQIDDTASSLGAGDMTAQCIPLDKIIGDGNVTFLKMDIEGAEMRALYGAEQCIKRCKPQLAICLYHKSGDIYEITSLIHKWLPDHKLYIRHHSTTFVETVLYAVPE